MPFIRLSDDYNDHPKIDALSDGAFRLWHQGMGFCRKYQTDGLIPTSTIRKFKAYSPKRMTLLLTPWKPDAHALWEAIDGFGVKVHDYLDWNLSREEEQGEKAAATARMRRLRSARAGVCSPEQGGERAPVVPVAEVPDRIGKESSVLVLKEEKKAPPPFKNGRFAVHRWQVEELMSMLGSHAEGFDLDEWLMTGAYRVAEQETAVIPNWWKWLRAATLREAQRRGLPIAATTEDPIGNKRIAGLVAGGQAFLNRRQS